MRLECASLYQTGAGIIRAARPDGTTSLRQRPRGTLQGCDSLFQLHAGALQEGAHHLGDALLHLRAQAALADETGEQVQLARVLPPEFHALRDLDQHTRAALFELRDVAQKVAALVRRGRPLDAFGAILRLRDGERLLERAHHRHFRPNQPAHHAARLRLDALHARHQLDEVAQIAEERPRPLHRRLNLQLLVVTGSNMKHKLPHDL